VPVPHYVRTFVNLKPRPVLFQDNSLSPTVSPKPLQVAKRLGKGVHLSSKCQQVASSTFKQDRLGKMVVRSIIALCHLSSWSCYVRTVCKRSQISRHVRRLCHKAAKHLDDLRRQGAKVTIDALPPSTATLQGHLARCPHKSALKHVEFVQEEFADFCEKGFWTVLPYAEVQHLPTLRLSPLGVVPQQDRRPRLIVASRWHSALLTDGLG